MMEKVFRERIRKMERLLGLLNDGDMKCCGITLAQCHALVEIGRAEQLSLNTLAELLNLDASTTSRTVQNLVASGLAKREPDPADRRAVLIALSSEGHEAFQSIEGAMDRKFKSVLKSIPNEKREQVMESLDLLLHAFLSEMRETIS